jgi:hypothetical protein
MWAATKTLYKEKRRRDAQGRPRQLATVSAAPQGREPSLKAVFAVLEEAMRERPGRNPADIGAEPPIRFGPSSSHTPAKS